MKSTLNTPDKGICDTGSQIQRRESIWYVIGLCLWVLFYSILILGWNTLLGGPIGWDNAEYLAQSIQYYNILNDRGIVPFLKFFLTGGIPKAPLTMLVALPFHYVFGPDNLSALATHVIYLMVISILLFLIGRELHSSGLGLLSVIVFCLVPRVFLYARVFYVEFGLSAAVTLTIFLMTSAKHRWTRRNDLLLGVAVGIGLLCKVTYPIFAIGPFVVWLTNRYVHQKSFFGLVRSLGVIAIVALAISGPWYALNLIRIIDYGWYAATWVQGSMGPVLNIRTVFSYWDRLLFRELGLYLFVALVLSLVGWVHVKRFKITSGFLSMTESKYVLLGSGILVPMAVFTLSVNKDTGHIVPMYPYLALIMASGLYHLIRRSRTLVLSILMLCLSLQTFLLTRSAFALWRSGVDYRPCNIEVLPKRMPGDHYVPGYEDRSLGQCAWDLDRALDLLIESMTPPHSALVLENHSKFNAFLFQYYAAKHHIEADIRQLDYYIPWDEDNPASCLSSFNVIICLDLEAEHGISRTERVIAARDYVHREDSEFRVLSRIPLSCSEGEIVIYHRMW